MPDKYAGFDEYAAAFSRYLRTGAVGALADFCDERADLACLQVYRNGFLRTCIEALRAGYPSVDRLVGGEHFPALARPYVEAHPPSDASLVGYGEGFSQFVEDARGAHRLDYLASFAALDRAWSEVFFAEDEDREQTPVSAGADAGAIMALRCRLAPRVRLVSLDFCALCAWTRLRQGALERQTEVRRAPQHVLIWRRGGELLYRALARPEHAFIARVAAGRPCAEAAGAAVEIDAEFDLAAAFASLLHHRMLERRGD